MKVREAWRECGERVPEYLKENARTKPHQAVQRKIFRMGHQLNDSTVVPPWKAYPEVKQRVETIVAKLAAEPRYAGKFGLQHQSGESKNKDVNA